jgi:hypothetical protein
LYCITENTKDSGNVIDRHVSLTTSKKNFHNCQGPSNAIITSLKIRRFFVIVRNIKNWNNQNKNIICSQNSTHFVCISWLANKHFGP